MWRHLFCGPHMEYVSVSGRKQHRVIIVNTVRTADICQSPTTCQSWAKGFRLLTGSHCSATLLSQAQLSAPFADGASEAYQGQVPFPSMSKIQNVYVLNH